LEIAVSDLDKGWLRTSRRNVRSRKDSARKEVKAGADGFSVRGVLVLDFASPGFLPVFGFERAGRLGTGGLEDGPESDFEREEGFGRGMLFRRSLWLK